MEGAALGLMGGIAGTLIGVAGAMFGCWMSYARAENDAQRALLRRLFVWIGLAATAFMAMIFATSFGLLPRWAYSATMLVVFVPLGLGIRWMNRRMAELSDTARK